MDKERSFSDTPVENVWPKGLPITYGEGSKMSMFGIFIKINPEDPGTVIVQIKDQGKLLNVIWPLCNTYPQP